MDLSLRWRVEDGTRLPLICWHPGPGYQMISSSVLGGGIGPREWVLNAQVPGRYGRTDPARHLLELASELGLTGPGAGMLTAAQVTDVVARSDRPGGARRRAERRDGIRRRGWNRGRGSVTCYRRGVVDMGLLPG